MADLEGIYRDGPPSRSELERWLRYETNASPADVGAILDNYAPEGFPTPDALRRFLGNQYQVYEGEFDREAPEGGGVITGPGRRAAEAMAEEGGSEQGQTPGTRLGGAAGVALSGGGTAPRSPYETSPSRNRSGPYPSWLEDQGPTVDPEALGTSIAVGIFTDRSGQPVLDENGQPTPVNAQTLWEAIRGTRFDMGQLRLRSKRPAPTEDTHPTSVVIRRQAESRWVTPSQMMAMLGGMDEDYLTGLQHQMWEAGLYGEGLPTWGVVDETTRQALMGLFAEASLTPDESVDRVMARLVDEQVRRAQTGEGTEGAGGEEAPVFQPEVTSVETLSAMIDDIAQDLIGQYVDPARKEALIGQLQAREIDTQRQAFGQDVAAQGGSGAEIDAFMTAIAGGETTAEAGGGYGTTNQIGAHGRYQIMPSNWGPWAERAGLGRSAPQTPQNQEIVARHMMLQYYNQFGNWRDVAIAWFAGPGAVGAPGAENRRDANQMTVRRYADEAMARMAQLRGAPPPPGAVGEMPAVVRFDPAAEAEAILRSQDPAAWESHQFGKRATEFYSLLGGVVGT